MQPLLLLMFQAEKSDVFEMFTVFFVSLRRCLLDCEYVNHSFYFFFVFVQKCFAFLRSVYFVKMFLIFFSKFICLLQIFIGFFSFHNAKLPTKIVIKQLFVRFITWFFKNRLSFCHANAGGSYDS